MQAFIYILFRSNRQRHCSMILFDFHYTCRYIVGLAGTPGAGKSTLALEVVQRLNKLWLQTSSGFDELVGPPDVAIVLPMDGFHLYRHQLDAMEVFVPYD